MDEGKGPRSLIEALEKHDKDITKVLGVNARAYLKGASIETMADGGTAPKWCWYFAPLDNEHTRVFDPVEMLTSSFKEKMDVAMTLNDLGIVPPGSECEAQEAAAFALRLAQKLGLV